MRCITPPAACKATTGYLDEAKDRDRPAASLLPGAIWQARRGRHNRHVPPLAA
jgi:hypothetical protein